MRCWAARWVRASRRSLCAAQSRGALQKIRWPVNATQPTWDREKFAHTSCWGLLQVGSDVQAAPSSEDNWQHSIRNGNVGVESYSERWRHRSLVAPRVLHVFQHISGQNTFTIIPHLIKKSLFRSVNKPTVNQSFISPNVSSIIQIYWSCFDL